MRVRALRTETLPNFERPNGEIPALRKAKMTGHESEELYREIIAVLLGFLGTIRDR